MVEILFPLLVFFAEPDFPSLDTSELLAVPPGAVVCRSVEALERELRPGRVLVWRHGSAFPAEFWPAFVRFLEAGGSFVHLGGEPFTRTVVGEPGARIVQARSVSLLKELRLNQCHRLDVPVGAVLRGRGASPPTATVDEPAWVGILEPRLSDTKDFAHEDGAPGSRDGWVTPIRQLTWGDTPRFPRATASFVIDRYRGRFAGGRWIFRLLSTSPDDAEVRELMAESTREPIEIRVDPTYGCYHEGERPVLNVRLMRPRALGLNASTRQLEVRLRSIPPMIDEEVPIEVGAHGVATVRAAVPTAGESYPPGLVTVTAEVFDRSTGDLVGEPVETGFWIRDEALFRSGSKLEFDGHTLLRDGVPEPVIGVTTMSATVQRKFLFEPNAAVWNRTFAELRACGINFVRTGVWSGYRKIALDPGAVDEAFLRNLEGYYLSARAHEIPILFTFFAFVPESFGGESPYFDPRSIEGQRAYVATVVQRFVDAPEMLWDLINEPSFASPDKLWTGRPHGDGFESASFRRWLERRYRAAPGGWEAEVRSRWRLRPDEPIGLPTDTDFNDWTVFENHRPYRAKEWVHFAQDAFIDWIAAMRTAIRGAGSQASVTVGQDEGGLIERPHPLFHAAAVDYTSMHSWWWNDALYFDAVMAKAPRKPLLVSETGVMNRELLSGEAMRTPLSSAQLLSRKLGYAFAAGAFGVVEWCYDVNPYMASDNEVAIGLRRVDGSYKPEHDVMRRFGRFFTESERAFTDPRSPRVALVYPMSDHYSPRGTQLDRIKRVVELFGRRFRIPVQVVPEYRTGGGALDGYDLVVLPSTSGLEEATWTDLVAAAEAGATVLTSGYFEADDAGRPAERLGGSRRELAHVEPVPEAECIARYSLDAIQSIHAADREELEVERPTGRGRLLHFALPVEAALEDSLILYAYSKALARAGVESRIRVEPDDPALLVRALEFPTETLVVVVNERPRVVATSLRLARGGPSHLLSIPPREAACFVFDAEGQLLDTTHRQP